MQFCKSEAVERWLSNKGATFSVEEVKHDRINRKVSRDNMARLSDAIIDEHVAKLLVGVDNGDVFPAIIGYCMDDGMYGLIDGNHRDEANLRNGCSPVLMYIVKSDDMAFIERLTRFANRDLNGEGQPKDVAIEHAIYLVEKYGFTNADAAAAAGVSRSAVANEKRVNQLLRFAEQNGVDASNVPKGGILAIGKLDGIDSVFLEAIEVAVSRHMTGEQVRDLVSCVDRVPNDEEKRLSAIAEYKAEHLTTRPKKSSQVKDKCVLAGKRLDAMLSKLKVHIRKYGTLEHNAVTGKSERVVMRRRIEEVVELLMKLADSDQ